MSAGGFHRFPPSNPISSKAFPSVPRFLPGWENERSIEKVESSGAREDEKISGRDPSTGAYKLFEMLREALFHYSCRIEPNQ